MREHYLNIKLLYMHTFTNMKVVYVMTLFSHIHIFSLTNITFKLRIKQGKYILEKKVCKLYIIKIFSS